MFKKQLISIQIGISLFLIIKFLYTKLNFADPKIYFYTFNLLIKLIYINLIIILFYKKKIIRTYALITLISLTLGFYISECYLLIKKNVNSKFEVYENRLIDEKNLVVAIPPMNHFNQKDIFPLSGISNSLTLLCNENGYFSEYKSDRYGFNNPDETWEKPIDLFLVGDSFAHGACVNRPYDLASLLRNKTKKNVISVAYGGNGPLIELASLKEYFQKPVKKVFWFYYEGNDLEGLVKEKKHPILIKYFQNNNYTQNIKNKQNIVDNLGKDLMTKAYLEHKKIKKNLYKKLVLFLKINEIRNLFIIKETNIKHPNNYEELIEKIKIANQFVVSNNADFYFVYLPEYSRYVSEKYNNINYYNIKEKIEDLNIVFIDIVKFFTKKTDKNPKIFFAEQKPGSHFTKEGYDQIANQLLININN